MSIWNINLHINFLVCLFFNLAKDSIYSNSILVEQFQNLINWNHRVLFLILYNFSCDQYRCTKLWRVILESHLTFATLWESEGNRNCTPLLLAERQQINRTYRKSCLHCFHSDRNVFVSTRHNLFTASCNSMCKKFTKETRV